jgi:drug/metabolite transporter (DMT)-like permease
MNESRPMSLDARDQRHLGIGLAAVTALISGVAVWANSYGVAQVPDAILYTTLKNGVAGILLGMIVGLSFWKGRASRLEADQTAATPLRHVTGPVALAIILVGLFGGGLAFILFFSGLAQATATGAAFIQKTLFIWVAVLAVPFLGERLGLVQVAALGALLAGQALLAPPRSFGWGSGETMILAATLIWAVEVVVARRLLRVVSSTWLGVARLGIGLVVLVGAVVAGGRLPALGAISLAGWALVVGTGFLLAAYVATWFAALQRAPASIVASVLVAGAVVTALLQAAVSGRAPDVGAVGGALLVLFALCAVVVTARPARRVQTA